MLLYYNVKQTNDDKELQPESCLQIEFQRIKRVPQVQIVMDMDGWGDKILKKSSYMLYEKRDPVQFTGFKLFYKNDIRSAPDQLYSSKEALSFQPKPIYIQYQ